ncbi:unnamed protein product [Arabidopsis lyrata]|uniref:Uncharacterized protein n=1 Tax=Arabidopsis lyrata subsp. lyrata TaxID=81972 RepID=D7MDR4_ARALL|nr:uncharacterized protein At4g00950 [Arabidopsis lyrata subsp. lyrata]EFH43740.1 hypothetical protein ARALYDRAFT_492001 [Arabidopsis lyrata subsp. lyrata]CAH8275119.1 unnamed protein product [Arabidopsis lyrata]|eukprot:XP_020872159.1 uncharacterized protein At4g00950 [Arabidopsis lyrata subsp. lyrata]
MDFEFDDQERFCATPKLPLFSKPLSRACETPGLATPPVNIAGSVPFLWEEAPGKPRVSDENKPPASKQNAEGGGGVVRCLELPPRLFFPAENEPSPTTVLDGPYVIPRRSLSVIRRSDGASEGRFDFSRSTNGRCFDRDGGGGITVKISRVKRKGSLLNLSHSSQFLARVYQGFKQAIPWRRRQDNLPRMSSSNI